MFNIDDIVAINDCFFLDELGAVVAKVESVDRYLIMVLTERVKEAIPTIEDDYLEFLTDPEAQIASAQGRYDDLEVCEKEIENMLKVKGDVAFLWCKGEELSKVDNGLTPLLKQWFNF